MKKFIKPIIYLSIILLLVFNINTLVNGLTSFIILSEPYIPNNTSEYKKDNTLSYVSNTDTFIPYSYQDLINILFTSINNGWQEFTFYCPDEYEMCLQDMNKISQDSATLTHLNNFIHPYNSFNSVKMIISESGEINLEVNYLYSKEMIEKIENETDKLLDELIEDDMDDYEKIKVLHDYIINNSKYDTAINKNETSNYQSHLAYGPLFEGYAICNGYTDLMAIYLTKLGYNNIKVATTPEEISYSTTGHIWNAVYLDDEWLHLDLTWDDPTDENNKDYLFHTYFLITTEKLHAADEGDIIIEEHHFNTAIYNELK